MIAYYPSETPSGVNKLRFKVSTVEDDINNKSTVTITCQVYKQNTSGTHKTVGSIVVGGTEYADFNNFEVAKYDTWIDAWNITREVAHNVNGEATLIMQIKPPTDGSSFYVIRTDNQGMVSASPETYEITLPKINTGMVRIDNGSAWDRYMVYIDNGSKWERYIPYVDDGTKWVRCG